MAEHLTNQDIQESRERLIAEIGDAARVLQNEWDAVDEAVSGLMRVNRTDMRCLDILDRLGPLTAGRLAEEAALSTGAVTAVVDRLEKRGLARRARDPADRRRVIVEALRERMEPYAWIYEWVVERSTREMERFSDAELRVVRDFVRLARDISREHAAFIRAEGPQRMSECGTAEERATG